MSFVREPVPSIGQLARMFLENPPRFATRELRPRTWEDPRSLYATLSPTAISFLLPQKLSPSGSAAMPWEYDRLADSARHYAAEICRSKTDHAQELLNAADQLGKRYDFDLTAWKEDLYAATVALSRTHAKEEADAVAQLMNIRRKREHALAQGITASETLARHAAPGSRAQQEAMAVWGRLIDDMSRINPTEALRLSLVAERYTQARTPFGRLCRTKILALKGPQLPPPKPSRPSVFMKLCSRIARML